MDYYYYDDDDDSRVNGEAKADSKPFSIRQFVADTRRKDVVHCWPFPKRYLQVCLKYGISNVLPPFELCINPPARVPNENVGRTCSDHRYKDEVSFENKVILLERLIKDEWNCSHDGILPKGPCHESNLSFDHTSNVTVPVNRESSSVQGPHFDAQLRIETVSPKKLRHKQRKHKGRRKKRSMSDILARAKPCTLDDCHTK
ncbi:uncharacterized protein LOC120213784 [Hibiscus syriacus]|uniref:uncharacterized protein LOC120213784 n=1 Tax=Hibiscus syriacus TaxID=106335 RepID=UPI001921BA6B|nr:uncharacterized protein LOC120213784 [Hibiscus syriacus]